MSLFAQQWPVIFWEEPIGDADEPWLELRDTGEDVTLAIPHLPEGFSQAQRDAALRDLLDKQLAQAPGPLLRWYYTPMMLSFSRHLASSCIIYDCMDELANFRFAPPELKGLEEELLVASDLVFTGGYSLYEAKRERHGNVHPFPSSVDLAHFSQGLNAAKLDPGRPLLGFYGVIDERMDLDLLAAVADARPHWSIVLVGPVVKIDPADLPQRSNITYTGGRMYAELPAIAGAWDVALMPFAIDESTRFISPTKTPEYLAVGLPVVSTPITDVIRQYGDLEGVEIAGTVEEFVAACERALTLAQAPRDAQWRREADAALSGQSWNNVVAEMTELIDEIMAPTMLNAHRPARYDYLIVGAGFAGAVMAERLARDAGARVLVVDRRPHIGGNAYDHYDDAGILVHRYGPHIFHTNSQDIVDYLSSFTAWRPYEHRVLADFDGVQVPIPINRTTLNRLYGLNLTTDDEAAAFLDARAEPVDPIRTSADVVVSKVGRELYELFFRGYTRKQWGLDPSMLDKSVTARVPTRTNIDDRYFTDKFQAMPANGYTAMFEAMLDHPLIDVRLGVDFDDIRALVDYDRLVFTGPIDEYFNHCYGKLPYRSLEFRHKTVDVAQFQPVGVVNYPLEDVRYTRITEYKHLTGQQSDRTSLTYEYPTAVGDPYYPIPKPENEALYKRYQALAAESREVLFVGRLATYRYYNMDQVVGQALATYRKHMAQISGEDGFGQTSIAAE